ERGRRGEGAWRIWKPWGHPGCSVRNARLAADVLCEVCGLGRPPCQSLAFLPDQRMALMPPLTRHETLLARVHVGHGDLPAAGVRFDRPVAGVPGYELDHRPRLQPLGQPVCVRAVMDFDEVSNRWLGAWPPGWEGRDAGTRIVARAVDDGIHRVELHGLGRV